MVSLNNDDVIFLSAEEEEGKIIGQGNAPLNEDGSFIQCFAIEVDGGVCLTYEDSGAPDEEDVVALDYFETLEEASAFFEQMMDQPLTYARRTNES